MLAQTTARGIWAMADFVEPGQASDGVPFEGAGYCREEYRKVDGSWRISRLHLTRLTRIEMAG
ncbi:nuclear transport factor 2 family protein [Rhodococcus sp. NPDC059968]|uniref:nuclear transport factor 2 family protein n=1 Tax=Rhodococcus sp. NPDC059968 TaxID=3347017 RepID=UPI00366E04C4